jgi:DNA replication protein DnaC
MIHLLRRREVASEAGLPLLLKQLKLTSIKDIWEEMAIKAADDGWSHAEYLAALMEIQANFQEQKRIQRYTKEAKLPCGKFLGSFNFESIPGLNRPQIEAYSNDISWIKRAENIMLFGASGLGKTHIASGIAYGLIQEGIRTLFASTSDITQRLQLAKSELRLPEALCKLDRYELLILDDIGYAKKDGLETTVLFDLIAHRYESKSLIITSNKPFSEWDEIFPDNMMAVAAIDRLVHHAKIYSIEGESYRRKHSLSKENSNSENMVENKEKSMLNSES